MLGLVLEEASRIGGNATECGNVVDWEWKSFKVLKKEASVG